MFIIQTPAWYIGNSQLIIYRDENFEPIINPDFVEQKDESGNLLNESERYKTTAAFDYIKMLMFEKKIPFPDLLKAYIEEEDKSERFN